MHTPHDSDVGGEVIKGLAVELTFSWTGRPEQARDPVLDASRHQLANFSGNLSFLLDQLEGGCVISAERLERAEVHIDYLRHNFRQPPDDKRVSLGPALDNLGALVYDAWVGTITK